MSSSSVEINRKRKSLSNGIDNKMTKVSEEEAGESSHDCFGPSEMAQIVKILKNAVDGMSDVKLKKFKNFTDYSNFDLPTDADSEKLRSGLKWYLKEAVIVSSMTMGTALDLLNNFLADGSSVTLHPKFPKRPPNGFNIFCKKLGGCKFDRSVTAHYASLWKSEDHKEERLESMRKYLEQQRIYMKELEDFRDGNPNLTHSHREYIDKAIASCQRMVHKYGSKNNSSPKLARQKQVKNCVTKTPFDIFTMANSAKYSDLKPEKRMKKLTKKFGKLSEAELEIYKNLATAM